MPRVKVGDIYAIHGDTFEIEQIEDGWAYGLFGDPFGLEERATVAYTVDLIAQSLDRGEWAGPLVVWPEVTR
jgi:hypothetical protein